VDVAGVAATFADAHLADGLEERQRLDVTHRATDLDDGDIGAFGTTLDVVLDLVGDVRYDLHGLAQILATTLFLDHGLVDLAGGEVVALAHARADVALIMAKIEVGLGTVIGHEHLAVLERAHGARIDVDVGIELEHGDFDAARLEDGAKAGGGDAFTQRGNDSAGYEYIFGHGRGLMIC